MSIKTIKHFSFDLSHKLGEGSTGTVYLGTDLRSGRPIAVKSIELKNIDNEVTQYLLKNQVKALQLTKHPNVLRAIDVIEDTEFCYIVTDYLSKGTLAEYIQKKGFISEEEALLIFKQLVDGYDHIFDMKIYHRDLKPHNILFDAEFHPVLSDFGYCEITGYLPKPKLTYNVGSPGYMAPESIVGNLYSENSEVWSLGTILYEMMTGRNYTNGKPVMEAVMLIKKQGPYYPQTSSDFVKMLLKESMMLKPEERMKIKNLKQLLHQHFERNPHLFNLALNARAQDSQQAPFTQFPKKQQQKENNFQNPYAPGLNHQSPIKQTPQQPTISAQIPISANHPVNNRLSNPNNVPDHIVNAQRQSLPASSPNIIRNVAPSKRVPIFNTPIQPQLIPDHLKIPVSQQVNLMNQSRGSKKSFGEPESAPFYLPTMDSIDDAYMIRNPFNNGSAQIPIVPELRKSGNFGFIQPAQQIPQQIQPILQQIHPVPQQLQQPALHTKIQPIKPQIIIPQHSSILHPLNHIQAPIQHKVQNMPSVFKVNSSPQLPQLQNNQFQSKFATPYIVK